jgi:hypothetical protein
MSSIPITLLVFAFSFGGALLGVLPRKVLPRHHLSEGSKDVLKMGMGLLATMSALDPRGGLTLRQDSGTFAEGRPARSPVPGDEHSNLATTDAVVDV